MKERWLGKKKTRERAIVEISTARAQTTTIPGAISPFGITSVKLRRLYESHSKKRKLSGASKASTSKAIKTTCIVTSYYFNFVGIKHDVLDKHEPSKVSTSSWIMLLVISMKISHDTLSIKDTAVHISPRILQN